MSCLIIAKYNDAFYHFHADSVKFHLEPGFFFMKMLTFLREPACWSGSDSLF